MKTATNLLLFLLLLLSYQTFSQVNIRVDSDKFLQERINSIPILDERVFETSKSDIFQDKETRTLVSKTVLDSLFLLEEELWQEWDGYNWVDDYKDSYTYDGNNNRIERLRQVWFGSIWVDYYKYIYTYDVNNNLVEELRQGWDGSNWVNDWKDTLTYDGNNNLIELLRQDWNDAWVNYSFWEYAYDVHNNNISILEKYWSGGWHTFLLYSFSYDVNNNLIEMLLQSRSGGSWLNQVKKEYILDNNNVVTELWKHWNDSSWINYGRYHYVYDEIGREVKRIWQLWEDSTYVNSYLWLSSYDINGNLSEVLRMNWSGSEFENYSKRIYNYTRLTEVEQTSFSEENYILLQNYPNPFNPSTTIYYSIPELSFVTVKVYDVLGNEVSTLINKEKPAGEYEVIFNASNLASGVYLYQLRAGDFIQSKKMILIK